jgi:hypothetical protein
MPDVEPKRCWAVSISACALATISSLEEGAGELTSVRRRAAVVRAEEAVHAVDDAGREQRGNLAAGGGRADGDGPRLAEPAGQAGRGLAVVRPARDASVALAGAGEGGRAQVPDAVVGADPELAGGRERARRDRARRARGAELVHVGVGHARVARDVDLARVRRVNLRAPSVPHSGADAQREHSRRRR